MESGQPGSDSASKRQRSTEPARARLAETLLTLEAAAELEARGSKEAGVLIAIFGHPESTGIVFTERRLDLPRHPGEISFPGGKPLGGEALVDCALRESQEEIALDPAEVEIVGALPPVSTVVTGYKVSPFVGLIRRHLPLEANPAEVERILPLEIDALRDGYEHRRLIRQGIPIRTPTYTVNGDLIWGATARILEDLLARIDSTPALIDGVG